MAEVQYSHQGDVWTYTYAQGPEAGKVFFHSPQRPWSSKGSSIVLRQANLDAENKVWIDNNPGLFQPCGDDKTTCLISVAAHGVIACDGFGKHLQPSCGSKFGDGVPLVSYSKGERIWVEQGLSPSTYGSYNLSVVSMDTLEFFEIPFSDICFVPQLIKTDAHNNNYLAICAGPAHEIINQGRSQRIQAYFEWPAGRPDLTRCKWDTWDPIREERTGLGHSQGYHSIESTEERQSLFQKQWRNMCEVVELEALYHSDSDFDSDCSAGTHKKSVLVDGRGHSSVNEENCCNLAPKCDVGARPIELAPGRVVALETLRHYHVLNKDVKRCSQGVRHVGHCVLRNRRRQCVLAEDPAAHTCCVSLNDAIAILQAQYEEEIAEKEANWAVLASPNNDPQDIYLNPITPIRPHATTYMKLFQLRQKKRQLQLEQAKRQLVLKYQLVQKQQERLAEEYHALLFPAIDTPAEPAPATTPVNPDELQQGEQQDEQQDGHDVSADGSGNVPDNLSTPDAPQSQMGSGPTPSCTSAPNSAGDISDPE